MSMEMDVDINSGETNSVTFWGHVCLFVLWPTTRYNNEMISGIIIVVVIIINNIIMLT